MISTMLLSFEQLSRPVALIGCDHLAESISTLLRGWRCREVSASTETPPSITIRRTSKGYELESLWRKSTVAYRDEVNTVCSFIVDLIKAYIAADSSLLCLHSAAAEFAGRLVVFPSHYKAGKSLLTAHLAAAGVRIYADDVLPINERGNRGVAPGILPRLRLPLPDGVEAAFHDYVERRSGLCNKRYKYLDLDADALAPLGEEAPIGAFVLLRRKAGVPPELTPVKKGEMLKRVILRNFSDEVRAADILDRLHDVVGDAQCFRLRYSGAAEAAELLKERFKRWPSRRRTARRPARSATAAAARGGGAEKEMYRRNPEILDNPVDDELFLVNSSGQAIYHLNAVGSALWRLLVKPIRLDAAVDVLRRAFPGVPQAQIERDVSAVLADLVKRGLINGPPPKS